MLPPRASIRRTLGPSTYRTSSELVGRRSRPAEPFSSAVVMDLWRWASWMGRWPWPAGEYRFSRPGPKSVRPRWPCRRHRSRRVKEAEMAAWAATAKVHCRPRPKPFYISQLLASRVEGAQPVSVLVPLPTHPRSSAAVNRLNVSSTPEKPVPSRNGAGTLEATAARPLAGSSSSPPPWRPVAPRSQRSQIRSTRHGPTQPLVVRP